MHKYLRAIGFDNFKTDEEVEAFLGNAIQDKFLVQTMELGDGRVLKQYNLPVAPSMGLSVVFQHSEDGEIRLEYYFPFLRSYDVTTEAECSIQRHTERETFAGLVEDYKIGITLIFYMCNSLKYRTALQLGRKVNTRAIFMTGLSCAGKILLPLVKRTDSVLSARKEQQEKLIEAARKGDQEAIDTLTAADMELYNQASSRLEREDLYSVVESTFMPCGVECDQYTVIGEITGVKIKENVYTREKVFDLRLLCNDLIFHVVIAQKDLLGEPAVGRRFKGRIWLQGEIDFD